jgi:hypothetical protein
MRLMNKQQQQQQHHFQWSFYLLHERKSQIHGSEGPQELRTRSQSLWGMGHGVGDVWAAFHVVG